MKNGFLLFLSVLLVEPSAFAQEDKLAIIGTMQYCQEAQVYYQLCMSHDASTHKKFEDNLTKITALALQVVKETNPNMSDAEISQLYLDRRDMLEKPATRSINKGGCEASQYLRNQYKACVEWHP